MAVAEVITEGGSKVSEWKWRGNGVDTMRIERMFNEQVLKRTCSMEARLVISRFSPMIELISECCSDMDAPVRRVVPPVQYITMRGAKSFPALQAWDALGGQQRISHLITAVCAKRFGGLEEQVFMDLQGHGLNVGSGILSADSDWHVVPEYNPPISHLKESLKEGEVTRIYIPSPTISATYPHLVRVVVQDS